MWDSPSRALCSCENRGWQRQKPAQADMLNMCEASECPLLFAQPGHLVLERPKRRRQWHNLQHGSKHNVLHQSELASCPVIHTFGAAQGMLWSEDCAHACEQPCVVPHPFAATLVQDEKDDVASATGESSALSTTLYVWMRDACTECVSKARAALPAAKKNTKRRHLLLAWSSAEASFFFIFFLFVRFPCSRHCPKGAASRTQRIRAREA